MGKKCIPGIVCVENMTLFLIFIAIILVFFLWNNRIVHVATRELPETKIVVVQAPPPSLANISARHDPFNDPYSPPLKMNGLFYPRDFGDMRGVPINIPSRGPVSGYEQVGILNRANGSGDMILPLMGRRAVTSRYKWQYYTISNSGNLNTKLPISVNGKSCTSENGCDEVMNGDVVYVEGYSETFRATIYENNLFRYIP
jgi:hypothetical protein